MSDHIVNGVVTCNTCHATLFKCACAHKWSDDGPFTALYSGVVTIEGHLLRCHVLSNAQRVFDCDDVEQLFNVVFA